MTTAGVAVEIRTEIFQNISPERYRNAILARSKLLYNIYLLINYYRPWQFYQWSNWLRAV
jgi:hypothetical protein